MLRLEEPPAPWRNRTDSSRIESDRDRPVVDELHLHARAELAGLGRVREERENPAVPSPPFRKFELNAAAEQSALAR